MSKLQQLAKKRKEQGGSTLLSNLNSSNSSSPLDSLLKRKKLQSTNDQKSISHEVSNLKPEIPTDSTKLELDTISTKPELPKLENKFLSQIILPDQQKTSKNQSHISSTSKHILISTIFSSFPIAKRRKLNIDINIPSNLAVKIKKNFEKQKEPVQEVKQKDEINTVTEKISKINITKPKFKIDIQDEINKKISKPLLSVIVIGHVDSGKSTTIGRLLYDLKIVDSRTLHKLTKQAEELGKGSFSLAWIMDQTAEERKRGVTIDIVQTQIETEKFKFNIIDSPGHKDYLPQMINGITQADVAIIIIDATSDLILNMAGSTFEQLRIAKNLGIENLLIVVNKMDLINWDHDRFTLINDTINDYLFNNLNYSSNNIKSIPISGFKGENIVKNYSNDWYNGPSLLNVLENINSSFNHYSNFTDPFAMSITDIQSNDSGSLLSKKADSLIIHGRIQSGIIQPGESIKIWPSLETAQIDSVITTSSKINSSNIDRINEKIGISGDFVELKLKKIETPDQISIGDIVTKIDSKELVQISDNINCEITLFELDRPLMEGTPFVLFRGVISYEARIGSIIWVETNLDGTLKKKKRKHVASNQRCKVTIVTDKSLPLLDIPKLNRIVLRKEGVILGAGIIKL